MSGEIHITLTDLIEAHRAAVMADEANFTDDCVPIDEAASQASGNAELEAYIALVDAKCVSAEDVQAKLGYFLNGSVGVRSTLLECLFDYGDDLHERFLKSLMVAS